MRYLKLFILVFLFVSCGHTQKEVSTQSQNTSFISIPVKFEEEIKEGMKLSDFVEKIEFVPLELTDECLLHGVDHAEVTEDYIYVREFGIRKYL